MSPGFTLKISYGTQKSNPCWWPEPGASGVSPVWSTCAILWWWCQSCYGHTVGRVWQLDCLSLKPSRNCCGHASRQGWPSRVWFTLGVGSTCQCQDCFPGVVGAGAALGDTSLSWGHPLGVAGWESHGGFKARYYGGSSSQCNSSVLECLTWDSSSSLLREDLCVFVFPPNCGSPHWGCGSWLDHISAPPTYLDRWLFPLYP